MGIERKWDESPSATTSVPFKYPFLLSLDYTLHHDQAWLVFQNFSASPQPSPFLSGLALWAPAPGSAESLSTAEASLCLCAAQHICIPVTAQAGPGFLLPHPPTPNTKVLFLPLIKESRHLFWLEEFFVDDWLPLTMSSTPVSKIISGAFAEKCAWNLSGSYSAGSQFSL